MAKSKNKGWGYHVLIAIDQLVNALLFGAADETISSRCYRGAVLAKEPKLKWCIAYKIVNALFFDATHCKTAYESELKRRQYPAGFGKI
ncbi:DNA helicase UvrD [Actinobacillus equuli subsp. haemolyticus]|uniref:DNA helicase UvrD n=1 Tax=Actinobacillus equuli TaxID=718 RepID=UPI002418B23D|nr:DNA helicase UvrD [Actinobacillus equuli]MDG4947388.1 DNA helicase UvrD [Actinobacillus equuli subsp. haemolyticus]MDG4947415.1 DNA helicase UvrD [Actinobacillus equuli subsp. haemolyticus]MDG4949265.1 DNA helicase UvrD [Actinobacillus equuli subsp. haemolyticus]